MKLAVFGATGQTGLQLVKQALAANHTVTAFVRNKAKWTMTNDNLSVEEVDVFDPKTFSGKLVGQDAVISCMGLDPNERIRVSVFSRSTQSILDAMKESGLKRLVLCHAFFTEPESRHGEHFDLWCKYQPMIRHVLNDMRDVEHYLEKSTDVDYTTVGPGTLTTEDVTDKEIKVAVGEFLVKGAGDKIGRGDVARFMLYCVDKDEYRRKQLCIGV